MAHRNPFDGRIKHSRSVDQRTLSVIANRESPDHSTIREREYSIAESAYRRGVQQSFVFFREFIRRYPNASVEHILDELDPIVYKMRYAKQPYVNYLDELMHKLDARMGLNSRAPAESEAD